MTVVERDLSTRAPSELEPEEGYVSICGTLLLEGVRWEADDAHFIRCSEIEVWGQGDDLQEAVNDFVAAALEMSHHLAEVMRASGATERETCMHALLADRFADVLTAIEEKETRRRDALKQVVTLRRRSFQRDANLWRPRPRNRSAPPLPA